MILYREGDCLKDVNENRIIVHVVNNKGKFGAGFALAIAEKYPIVKERYLGWYEDGKKLSSIFNFGQIQPVKVNDLLTIVNMLSQDGLRSSKNTMPLQYDALEKCLISVKNFNTEHNQIWMADLIGCGLAGGDREKVLEMIERIFQNDKVIIFKLENKK